MNNRSKNIIFISAALVAGLLLGWLFFSGGASESGDGHQHTESEESQTWTCSMHPSVKQSEPGDCPICGMDLIPLDKSGGGDSDPAVLEMTKTAAKIAQVQTSEVTAGVPEEEIPVQGKIRINQNSAFKQTAHIPGRIEKLYYEYEGEYVSKGTPVAEIYSPELSSAQKEFLEAVKMKDDMPGVYESSRKKLKNWKLSDKQIDAIEEKNKVRDIFIIRAEQSGYLQELDISEGDYVKTGMEFYSIYSLGTVWVEFDIYESNIEKIDRGDLVKFTVNSYPGEEFSGKITYIDPQISQDERVAIARATVSNPAGKLKPEMFVNGRILVNVSSQDGLVSIPATAVLWTGKRSIVYVEIPDSDVPKYEMREVTLGSSTNGSYMIEDGLSAGERVVTNGVFNVDAAAQLNNKASMMNRHIEISDKKEEKKTAPDFKESTPEEFQKQLGAVVKSYLELSAFLIETDFEGAKKKLPGLTEKVNKIDMMLLSGNAHDNWMKIQNSMKDAIEKMKESENIDQLRKHYIKLSDNMISAVKSYGTGEKIYVQFCPMANDDQGAYWLSKKTEILNPYFGDMMLHCGEVRDSVSN